MSRDPREDESGLGPPALDGPRRRLSRRRVLSLGAVGAVAAGAYAVSRGPALSSLPQLAGLDEPSPPERHLDPQPVDFRGLQARQRIGSAVHVGLAPDEIRSYGAWPSTGAPRQGCTMSSPTC